jgi:agmatinase
MTTDNTSRDTADRMDLPFVGLATFARQPACPDWDKLNGADVARIPFEMASSYRVGTRFGPRAIREVSMFHGFGPEGVFDFEDEFTYLTADEMKFVDAGDSDVISADKKRRHGISTLSWIERPQGRTRRPKRTAVVSRLPNRRPVNETGAAQRS